jgi:hypothetical protein
MVETIISEELHAFGMWLCEEKGQGYASTFWTQVETPHVRVYCWSRVLCVTFHYYPDGPNQGTWFYASEDGLLALKWDLCDPASTFEKIYADIDGYARRAGPRGVGRSSKQ